MSVVVMVLSPCECAASQQHGMRCGRVLISSIPAVKERVVMVDVAVVERSAVMGG